MAATNWLQLLPQDLKDELAQYWYRNHVTAALVRVKRQMEDIEEKRKEFTRQMKKLRSDNAVWAMHAEILPHGTRWNSENYRVIADYYKDKVDRRVRVSKKA